MLLLRCRGDQGWSTCHRIPGSLEASSLGGVALGTPGTYLQTLDTPHVVPEVIWSTLSPDKDSPGAVYQLGYYMEGHGPWRPTLPPHKKGTQSNLKAEDVSHHLFPILLAVVTVDSFSVGCGCRLPPPEDSQYTVKFRGSLRLTLTGFRTSHW
ncbi:Gm19345 [Phodopus roborovskii]|uniref:Gm19345 protein n=1 Tax=Phodopus roborovskii TaxID=109678 RepID=A0AAV0A822_PHORO|nr:Gm19345 [Phodopus roborovskii]